MLARYLFAVLFFIVVFAGQIFAQSRSSFVSVKGTSLILNGKPYFFVGANYW